MCLAENILQTPYFLSSSSSVIVTLQSVGWISWIIVSCRWPYLFFLRNVSIFFYFRHLLIEALIASWAIPVFASDYAYNGTNSVCPTYVPCCPAMIGKSQNESYCQISNHSINRSKSFGQISNPIFPHISNLLVTNLKSKHQSFNFRFKLDTFVSLFTTTSKTIAIGICPSLLSSDCTICNATHGNANAFLSVCPYICQTRTLWQNERNFAHILTPHERYHLSQFSDKKNGWWEATPST